MIPSAAAPSPSAPSIHIQGATKRFNRAGVEVVALASLDLRVEPGQFVSIIGPSGCGKSTLLRSVCGLSELDAGRILIGSESPTEARQRKHFGFVPQTPALLEWRSVRKNIELLLEVNTAGRAIRNASTSPRPRRGPSRAARHEVAASESRVEHIMERVGLTAAANAMPRQLSGGMQQRVSLARAFALDAPVLIMDEPFSALDELTRAEMRYLLLELWNQSRSTVLFVTHNIDEAIVLSDRVVVMAGQPGRIVLEEDITLGRPRQTGVEDDPAFRDHAARIRAALSTHHGRRLTP